MPLNTLVKVANITNLSDARYCAGMGVDMLGFRVIEGEENHLPIPLYQQIRGWVSGPKVVAEMYGIKSAQEIQPVIVNYVPDLIEMTFIEYQKFSSAIQLPFIVMLSHSELHHITEDHPQVKHWMISHEDVASLPVSAFPKPLLVKIQTKTEAQHIQSNKSIGGVVLTGTPEIRPGYKNYDDLADVLEALDVDA